MDLVKIYTKLGLETNLTEEIIRFNNRLVAIINKLDHYFYYYDEERNLQYSQEELKEFCFNLGLRVPSPELRFSSYFPDGGTPEILTNNILNLTCVLETINRKVKLDIIKDVKNIFSLANLDIGYVFSGNQIIKSGAKELDENLLTENLQWLGTYPSSKILFSNALKYHLNKNYPDAITNAYSALEGITKSFLGSDKVLDNDITREKLINKLGLESYWGNLLRDYSKAAHEFSSRHGRKTQKVKNELDDNLSEFYLYLTGVFIRLISRK